MVFKTTGLLYTLLNDIGEYARYMGEIGGLQLLWGPDRASTFDKCAEPYRQFNNSQHFLLTLPAQQETVGFLNAI